MARIIVISDLHFSSSDHKDVYDSEGVSEKLTASLSENIYDLLLSALESEKESPDLLVFCGDYVVARETEEEKKKAMDCFISFLRKIENSRKILKGNRKNERIVIVPGNHDIVRGDEEIYKNFRSALSRYRTPFTDPLDCSDAPTFVYNKLKLIVDCEATEDNSSTSNEKIQGWIDKVKAFKVSEDEKEELIKELEKEKISDIPSVPASISKRFKNTANKLALEKKYDAYFKIMVTHHPLMSGIEAGKTIKSFNNTIGGFDFMRAAMGYGYTLFIHGHIHERTCIELTDFGREKPHSSVQLGVPNLEINKPENGIVVIDTDKTGESNWPFSIIYKTLSDYTRTFTQSRVLEGEKKDIIEDIRERDNMELLVDKDIITIVDEGKIIKNGDRDRVEAASYDCALGYEYKKSNTRYCDWGTVSESRLEASDSAVAAVTINPGETVLIYTYEEFDVPRNMVMHASPISSWLRKGLQVDISHFVDPGFKGQFCFPVVNESEKPISISSREPIMSIELIRLTKSCEKSWSERHSDKVGIRKQRKD